MSQFCAYKNPNPASRTLYPSLLEIQSDLRSGLRTTLVIPLTPAEIATPISLSRLNPTFTLDGKRYTAMTQDIAGIDLPLAELCQSLCLESLRVHVVGIIGKHIIGKLRRPLEFPLHNGFPRGGIAVKPPCVVRMNSSDSPLNVAMELLQTGMLGEIRGQLYFLDQFVWTVSTCDACNRLVKNGTDPIAVNGQHFSDRVAAQNRRHMARHQILRLQRNFPFQTVDPHLRRAQTYAPHR